MYSQEWYEDEMEGGGMEEADRLKGGREGGLFYGV